MKSIQEAESIASKILQNPSICTGFIKRGRGCTQEQAAEIYRQQYANKDLATLAAEVAEWLRLAK